MLAPAYVSLLFWPYLTAKVVTLLLRMIAVFNWTLGRAYRHFSHGSNTRDSVLTAIPEAGVASNPVYRNTLDSLRS